jgi:DGQHR domain-containing protein
MSAEGSNRAFEVMRFSQRMGGEDVDLYVSPLPVAAILERFDVDVYDPGKNPSGYQRRPVEYRFREIARYVQDHEGLLPTAILVNLREGVKFEPYRDGDNVGLLKIPEKARLWVVDGQHRVYGLREAEHRLKLSDPDAELAYDVPVVFTVGLNKLQEMRLFHVVNSKAKSVPTDLAARLLFEAIRAEGKAFVHGGKGSEKDYRKAVGTRVAYHLNGTPGPWQGRIRLPNEPASRKKKPLQVNAIASSLEPALRDNYLRTIYEPETDKEWPTLCGLVFTYWQALSELMPQAFADIENHSVQRTGGAYAFHEILPDVLYRCRENGDFSVKGFKSVLSNLGRWVTDQTWHTEHGEPLTRSTGMSAIRALADMMRAELPPLETPGLPTAAEEGARAKEILRRAGVVYGE